MGPRLRALEGVLNYSGHIFSFFCLASPGGGVSGAVPVDRLLLPTTHSEPAAAPIPRTAGGPVSRPHLLGPQAVPAAEAEAGR